MITLFVDSNLFLQCKDIKNLDWENLFPKKTLKILIPRAVQKEIDGFKGQGNTRRSKRAKATSTYFKEVLKNTGALSITSQLSICFPSRRELSAIEREPSLDSNKNDDSIIQDILSYQKLHTNENVMLLTNDSGLMVTAREYGITFIDIPESWLLEPEPDDKDKKINDLEKRIKAFETNFPEIHIQANTNNEQSITTLAIKFTEYPELSSIEIDELINRIKLKNPMKVNFDDKLKSSSLNLNSEIQFIGLNRYYPPSENNIREYTETLYPEWEEEVRASLTDINTYIHFQNNISNADIIITNNGQIPAEGVLFEVNSTEHFLLYLHTKDDLLDKGWELPIPPEAPKGKFVNSYASLTDLAHSLTTPKFDLPRLNDFPQPRDKNSFYWKSKPSTFSNKWVQECEEFRHQMQPEVTSLRLIPSFKQRPTGGKITCSVSAKNLPNPVNLSVIIKVSHELGNTYEEALKLIGY